MKLIVLHLGSLGLALSSPSNLIRRDPKSYSSTWGETHTRDSKDSSGDKSTPFIVLPSTSNSNRGYSLTDFPRNNDWGLVEIDRDFDLIADEFADKSDNFVYTQTENPNEFLPSSHDPWKAVVNNPTESSPIIDDRLFETHSATDLTELDFTWNPSKSISSEANIDQGKTNREENLADKQIVYQEGPKYEPVTNDNTLQAEHRGMELSGPIVDTSSVKSAVEYGTKTVLATQEIQGAIALPLLDNNNVYVDPAFKSNPQPKPPNKNTNTQPPLGYAGFISPPIQNAPPPLYQPPSPQFIKRPAHPPPSPVRTVPQPVQQRVQRPLTPRLPTPIQTAAQPVHQLQHLQTVQPIQQVQPVQPDQRVQKEEQVTKLSKNPLTRFKQQLNFPNPSLPSLNQIRENIESMLPSFATIPTAPPRQGYGNSGLQIPTVLGTVLPGIIPPGTKKPWLLHSISDSIASLMSSSSKAGSTNPNSNPYTSVTEAPIPLPVPTYLPISKNSEFSAGFQILVQYIAAMVGFALILAI